MLLFTQAIFCSLTLVGVVTSATVVTNRPIVGILTQPLGDEHKTTDEHAYIAASYVKFLESSGARVVPIFHNDTQAGLRSMFKSVNGLLLPGGGSNISTGSQLHSAGYYLYNLALEANNRGDVFPIWGTCMGFQFLTLLTAGEDNVLCRNCFNTEGLTMPLNFTEGAKRSRLFGDMAKKNPSLFDATASQKLTANSHHDGILNETFSSNVRLQKFYDVLSTNTDPTNGRVFVSSIEAKEYPILATQWHPEKNNFEWRGGNAVNHSVSAVQLSQYVGDTFVTLARQSRHSFIDEKTEEEALIYNYNPIKDPAGYFEQIYLWI